MGDKLVAMEKQGAVRKKWTKKRWSVIVIAILVVLCGAWWQWNRNQGEKVVIGPVKADDRVLAEGIVYPVKYAQMVMPVDGTIGEILVKEGDQVKAGQPIVRLQRGDYQARVGSAWSSVAQMAASVEQARVNLSESQQELGRQLRMGNSGATSRKEIDQAKNAVERNQAALVQAQAVLAAEQGKASESERQLDKTELRAPIDGMIAFLDAKVGEPTSAGTVLVRIEDPSNWEVRSDDLTELVVAKVHVGDPVVLTFDGIEGLEIPGKVKFIREYGEKKRGDITYTVFIAPDRWDDHLRWMMTAQIAITPAK